MIGRIGSSNTLRTEFCRQEGFTLIEIMVSAVILFSAIALVSHLYQGANLNSQKAEQHIKISGAMPLVLKEVKLQLNRTSKTKQQTADFEGNISGVSYNYRAQVIAISAAPPKLNPDVGQIEAQKNKYKLWRVELNVGYQTLVKTFDYQVLGWNDE
jgi:prepilin-type N-terminal cleavage/methylation domain-containing protein